MQWLILALAAAAAVLEVLAIVYHYRKKKTAYWLSFSALVAFFVLTILEAAGQNFVSIALAVFAGGLLFAKIAFSRKGR